MLLLHIVTCPARPVSAKMTRVGPRPSEPGGTMHRAAPRLALLGGLVLAGPLAAAGPPPRADLAARARAALQTHCAACHGGGSRARSQGGLGHVLDRERLIS